MSSRIGIAPCPHCHRTVRTVGGCYEVHNIGEHTRLCPLSLQHTVITGDSPTAYVSRARLVANLAEQVQDFDPAIVWTYLDALPVNELRRLAMIALAAIPVDQTVEQMFGWVTELPAAKVVAG
jgi:hypothetical protein